MRTTFQCLKVKWNNLLNGIIYLHDFKQINLLPFEICRGKIYKSWIHDNDRPPLACKCCRNWCRSCNVLAWRILNVQGLKFQNKVIFLGIISWFVLGKRQIVQAKELYWCCFSFAHFLSGQLVTSWIKQQLLEIINHPRDQTMYLFKFFLLLFKENLSSYFFYQTTSTKWGILQLCRCEQNANFHEEIYWGAKTQSIDPIHKWRLFSFCYCAN